MALPYGFIVTLKINHANKTHVKMFRDCIYSDFLLVNNNKTCGCSETLFLSLDLLLESL